MTQPAQISDSLIRSDQSGPHPDLDAIVSKHLLSTWRKPAPNHTLGAAAQAIEWLQTQNRASIILDSFCGTGMSTASIAEQYPNAAVIGVDKSSDRLAKHSHSGAENYLLLRAECEPFWQLLVGDGISLSHHFLLYPNPWPKAGQLKRRIHGHPAFPLLATLGGRIELRTNWGIYAEEFAQAAEQIGVQGRLQPFSPEAPISLFERKYSERQQTLWQFTGEVGQ